MAVIARRLADGLFPLHSPPPGRTSPQRVASEERRAELAEVVDLLDLVLVHLLRGYGHRRSLPRLLHCIVIATEGKDEVTTLSQA